MSTPHSQHVLRNISRPNAAADLSQLKIAIVSTPKTGNTWLKSLLAAVYDLPSIELPPSVDTTFLNKLGDRWIGHEHYHPERNLLDWATQHDVRLITTIRHPCDVLVSYIHYLRNYVHSSPNLIPSMVAIALDNEVFGRETAHFVQTGFRAFINMSISWLASQRSYIVRYEDLWADTVGILTTLTNQIHPVSQEQILRAVEQCDLSMMRGINKSKSKFFRSGRIGGWHAELPPELVELFRTLDPYPAQFAALGYSLDPGDPRMHLVPVPMPSFYNPFRELSQFDNGALVSPIVARMYLAFESVAARARWPNVADTQAPDSFFAWLNAPADRDPHRDEDGPIVTNLADYVYRQRPDLAGWYPDIFGYDRVGYLSWFVEHAAEEHQLDPAFVEPVREQFLRWASAPDPSDRARGVGMPALTNLAIYLYRRRTDISANLSRVYDRDRIEYLAWFMQHAAIDHRLPAAVTQRAREDFGAWAVLPDPADSSRDDDAPLITNLAAHVYQHDASVKAQFPDTYREDRVDYLLWFINNAYQVFDIEVAWTFSVIDSLLAWGNAPEPTDRVRSSVAPPLSRMAAHLYRRDQALKAKFPDVYGADRVDYLIYRLENPVRIDSWGRGDFERGIQLQWAALVQQQAGQLLEVRSSI